LRIAFVGLKGIPARFGGVEAHVEAIATRLAARGHDVEVYVRSWYTELETKLYRGVRLRHVPTIREKHLDATIHTFLSTIDGLVRRHDLLHFHTVAPGTFAFLPAMTGARSVLTIHSLDWQRAKWSRPAKAMIKLGATIAIRSATSIIAVSRDLADYVDTHHGRKPHFVPNGVEPPGDVEPDRAILDQLGLVPDRYLLFLGRFVPEKRLEALVDAFRAVAPDGMKLVLGGDAEDAYGRAIRERACGIACLFPGVVFGEAKEALLRNARLAVLPSSLEGLPIFLLEAMARGVLCLASDLPPHRELLGEGRGLTATGGLADALREALNLPETKRRGMAAEARRYVESHHNWDRVVEATEKVYERTLSS
jgi:glycosyltransferase involved in cell wall biosynthesis